MCQDLPTSQRPDSTLEDKLRRCRITLSLLSLSGILAGCGGAPVDVVPSRVTLPPSPPPPAARIAVVIDDVGNNERALSEALAMTIPVTFAVLPRSPYTQRLAEKLSRGAFEIMLHQPMEPASPSINPGPGSISSAMSREQVESILTENLRQIPRAVGVNNHTGSKATASRRLMEIVLPFLAERGLFFLDSLTTSRSVCREVAADMGIPIGVRDVFLDNVRNREQIIAQIETLKRLALKQGEAIAIGHFHALTLATLEEMAPALEGEGIQFVFVSTLIRASEEKQSAAPSAAIDARADP